MVREAVEQDREAVLELYLHLHEDQVPPESEHLKKTWEKILRDESHHLIVFEEAGKIVSSCVCVVIPNLTRSVRPYALIENVVTHADYRGKGYAGACLAFAKRIAQQENCYKIMLLTGSKEEKTLQFYKNAGFDDGEKTGFVLRLP